ncbi:CAP-Gly domain-containing linker protein 4-like isoform X4 [Gadus chalcogrammus]|uniref:CAP-Gly domain-containing linker protein 4-like isoform X4 n=1 Tax=Gadus chalcogrammus TaxID=1042646 RepID=UPI0024C4201C|nr:CAP-Gly domain-containing linker protein 4-like isoform X4 [Gadus chalcogrammus]
MNQDEAYGESNSPQGEMTKEDVPEPLEGRDSVLGHHARLSAHLQNSGPQQAVIHQVASAPMPSDCEFSFFDPSDHQCREILLDPNTTVPELFAVLRQWVPQVQKNVDLIGSEILKRGCGVNDRDGLTDMSLLHYCCKAGAPGIGDADTAASFARHLLALGGQPNLRSRWTNMRALHYAAYFDVPQLIRVVLQASQPGDVDATCSDFDFGTALHIAASNLCTSAVRCLLDLGANPAFKNERGQRPADVVPDPLNMPLEMADAAGVAKELHALLRETLPRICSPVHLGPPSPPPALSDRARAQLGTLGIRLGDRVVIAGQKVGTLRFCGSTEFSGGLWAGVELELAEGKNDGSVAGVQYFTCQNKHGIFAPLSKISKRSERRQSHTPRATLPPRPPRRLDLSRVTSKVNTGGLSRSLSSSSSSLESRHVPAARTRPSLRQRPPARQRRERVSPGPVGEALPRLPASSTATSLARTGPRSRTPSASSSVFEGPDVHVGERVLVVGQRAGVVQFCGQTSFAPGLWLGIELDKPSGKNDGSVGGLRYFSCPPKHGVFAPPSRVQRIHGSVDCLSELSSSRLNRPFTGSIRRSSSTSTAIDSQKDSAPRSPVNRRRSLPHRQRWNTLSSNSSAGGGRGGGTSGRSSVSPAPPPGGADGQARLRVGSQVLLSSTNEAALVRYVGAADFAAGLWLGLELRAPRGKNDGAVGGRRYFTCRPGHGVLVRPSRVTQRGVNGARLVDDIS